MIPFHVVQQGYTVRLNAGCIPFQKINLLYGLGPPAPAQSLSAVCAQ